MTTNAKATDKAQAAADKAQADKAQAAQAARAALVAKALAQGAQAAAQPKARTRKLGYGVFETPEGHLIKINYDERGRETNWTLHAPDMAWAANFRTKRDALAWLDATGDLAAQAAAVAALRK